MLKNPHTAHLSISDPKGDFLGLGKNIFTAYVSFPDSTSPNQTLIQELHVSPASLYLHGINLAP